MKGTPKDIGDELKIIQRRHSGILRAEDVVDAVEREPQKFPHLHAKLPWDDRKAAHQWRVHLVRNIIRVWVTVIPQAEKEHRVWVSLMSDRAQPGGGYRSTVDVMSNEEHRAELLEQARAELEVFRRKYRDLKELADVFAAIDRLAAG